MELKICSMNVKGLKAKKKRLQVCEWFKQKYFDICLLQETLSTDLTNTSWQIEWGGKCYSSGISSKSTGVMILINPNFSCEILQCDTIIPGRILALKVNINDYITTIITVYGPNEDSLNCFNSLDNYLSNLEEGSVIIAGDFNTILDPSIDKKNGNPSTHLKCREKIHSIIEQHDLIDIWRIKTQTKGNIRGTQTINQQYSVD